MGPGDMYAAYVKERLGLEVEVEPGKGFATWRLMYDPGDAAFMQQSNIRDVYLADIYVEPEHRKNGVASALAERVAERGSERGATRMLGSVDTRANTRTDALKAILAAGFQVERVDGPVIWVSRKI